MKSHQVALLLSTFATVALVAPQSGGFTSSSTPPDTNPIDGISVIINGTGNGSIIPFNPTTGGAIPSNFLAANATIKKLIEPNTKIAIGLFGLGLAVAVIRLEMKKAKTKI